MSTTSRARFVGLISICALIGAISTLAGGAASIQLNVKDPRGKPAVGVKVWIEGMGSISAFHRSVTGAHGEATFQQLAPGTYQVNAYDSRTPTAAAALVTAGAGESKSVTLSLDKIGRNSEAPKKKHYVYV